VGFVYTETLVITEFSTVYKIKSPSIGLPPMANEGKKGRSFGKRPFFGYLKLLYGSQL
jgi:hypothetical protein